MSHQKFVKKIQILFFLEHRNIRFRSLSEPYINSRYFPHSSPCLPALTTAFGPYHGIRIRVGLDSHEVKLHAKFNDMYASNKHKFLKNACNGNLIFSKLCVNDLFHFNIVFVFIASLQAS